MKILTILICTIFIHIHAGVPASEVATRGNKQIKILNAEEQESLRTACKVSGRFITNVFFISKKM